VQSPPRPFCSQQARQNTHFVRHPAGRRSAPGYSTILLRAYSISARLSRMYSSNRLLYVGCQRLSAGRFSVMSARARQHTRPNAGRGGGAPPAAHMMRSASTAGRASLSGQRT
jgi:hypothetical protein